MLKLQDILRFSEEESENARVRFSMFNGKEDPKYIYLRDPYTINTKWFLNSGKNYNNFKCGMTAISLIMIDRDLWLLTAIKRIISVRKPRTGRSWDYSCYETEDVEKYRNLCGRTYVSFHKNRRSGKYKWNTIADRLIVSKIESDAYGDNTFKGYKFELSFTNLETILDTGRTDWKNALGNIQAVYLITDNSNGKQYVGSATNKDEFLLGRWRDYIHNGHGGNKRLMDLVKTKGMEYVRKNFSFRILDYFSENYPSSKVVDFESYWKDVLKTREFGYNAN